MDGEITVRKVRAPNSARERPHTYFPQAWRLISTRTVFTRWLTRKEYCVEATLSCTNVLLFCTRNNNYTYVHLGELIFDFFVFSTKIGPRPVF
jgi:aminoglycoside N3'-acetyltransferase